MCRLLAEGESFASIARKTGVHLSEVLRLLGPILVELHDLVDWPLPPDPGPIAAESPRPKPRTRLRSVGSPGSRVEIEK